MCKLAYEKCVCFLFLVILAILSCSGFRIDNLAMTDISKKNFHTSDSSLSIDPVFHDSADIASVRPHRIRHQRPFRRDFPIPPNNEQFVPQIPRRSPSVSRSQRSMGQKNKKKRKQKQPEDIFVRAYKAEIVLRAENIGRNKSSGNQWVFKVKKVYKDVRRLHKDQFVLKVDLEDGNRNLQPFQQEYLLFLNASSPTRFWAVASPKLIRRKFNEPAVIKICRPDFVPKPPKIVELREMPRNRNRNNRRILRCRVKGFPVPKISWKRDGKPLHQNHMWRIQYKRKESRLIIKRLDAKSVGEYECEARGVDERATFQRITITQPIHVNQTSSEKFFSGKECDDNEKVFCYNGGTCQKESTMGELYCICPPFFSGKRCEKKDPTNTSSQ